jgi:hypothetical protein
MGKNFLFSISSRPVLLPSQVPIEWVPEALSPGVKRSEHEADHSPPTSTEVKETWIYTSISTYAFMVLSLIKHSNVTFYSGIYLEGQRNVTTFSFLAEIRTEHLPNKSVKRYQSSSLGIRFLEDHFEHKAN